MIRLFLLPVFMGLYLIVRFLPWWTIPIGIATCYIFFRLAGKWLLKRAFLIPFEMKGRKAELNVTAVAPA